MAGAFDVLQKLGPAFDCFIRRANKASPAIALYTAKVLGSYVREMKKHIPFPGVLGEVEEVVEESLLERDDLRGRGGEPGEVA